MKEWWIDKEDINKSRTKEEATQVFAETREGTFEMARNDFSVGFGLGVRVCVVIAVVGLALVAFT